MASWTRSSARIRSPLSDRANARKWGRQVTISSLMRGLNCGPRPRSRTRSRRRRTLGAIRPTGPVRTLICPRSAIGPKSAAARRERARRRRPDRADGPSLPATARAARRSAGVCRHRQRLDCVPAQACSNHPLLYRVRHALRAAPQPSVPTARTWLLIIFSGFDRSRQVAIVSTT